MGQTARYCSRKFAHLCVALFRDRTVFYRKWHICQKEPAEFLVQLLSYILECCPSVHSNGVLSPVLRTFRQVVLDKQI